MSKGFIKFETNEVDFITVRSVQSSDKMHSAYVYVPKKYRGRRAIVAILPDHQGGDHSE